MYLYWEGIFNACLQIIININFWNMGNTTTICSKTCTKENQQDFSSDPVLIERDKVVERIQQLLKKEIYKNAEKPKINKSIKIDKDKLIK